MSDYYDAEASGRYGGARPGESESGPILPPLNGQAMRWPESQAGRFRVSTVNAVESAVQALGYDAALARAEAIVSLRRASGIADEARLAQERLDCLRAYEDTLRASEAARQAHGTSCGLPESECQALTPDEGLTEHPETEALRSVLAADEPRDGRKPSTSFERQIQRVQDSARRAHTQSAERIPTDVLVAEVERRGYSAVKVTTEAGISDVQEAQRITWHSQCSDRSLCASRECDLCQQVKAASDEYERDGSPRVTDEQAARAEAEAWHRATKTPEPESQPIPEPTTEERIDRLERALEQAFASIRSLEGRAW